MLFKEITKEELNKVINNSFSIFECLKKLGLPQNGRYFKKLDKLIAILNIDISHFGRGSTRRKLKRIIKKCPICNKEFLTSICKREKIVCSKYCSNVYFKKGFKEDKELKSYTILCFRYHKRKCLVCKEEKIVEVHHFDENHNNNNKENLIPLCANHHQYMHSRYKNLINEQVIVYREDFLNKIRDEIS